MRDHKGKHEPEEVFPHSYPHTPDDERTKHHDQSKYQVKLPGIVVHFGPLEWIGPRNKRKTHERDEDAKIGRIKKMPTIDAKDIPNPTFTPEYGHLHSPHDIREKSISNPIHEANMIASLV